MQSGIWTRSLGNTSVEMCLHQHSADSHLKLLNPRERTHVMLMTFWLFRSTFKVYRLYQQWRKRSEKKTTAVKLSRFWCENVLQGAQCEKVWFQADFIGHLIYFIYFRIWYGTYFDFITSTKEVMSVCQNWLPRVKQGKDLLRKCH